MNFMQPNTFFKFFIQELQHFQKVKKKKKKKKSIFKWKQRLNNTKHK